MCGKHSEKIRALLRLLGHVERKTEEHGSEWTPKDRKTKTKVDRYREKKHKFKERAT